jgi:hypothetical protein
VGDGGGLDPGGDAELGQDVGDVDAGRLGADEQRLSDLAVAGAGRDQRQDLSLTRGEAELLGRGRRRGGRRGDVRVQAEAGALGQGLDLGVEGAGAEAGGDRGGTAQASAAASRSPSPAMSASAWRKPA